MRRSASRVRLERTRPLSARPFWQRVSSARWVSLAQALARLRLRFAARAPPAPLRQSPARARASLVMRASFLCPRSTPAPALRAQRAHTPQRWAPPPMRPASPAQRGTPALSRGSARLTNSASQATIVLLDPLPGSRALLGTAARAWAKSRPISVVLAPMPMDTATLTAGGQHLAYTRPTYWARRCAHPAHTHLATPTSQHAQPAWQAHTRLGQASAALPRVSHVRREPTPATQVPTRPPPVSLARRARTR
jgi:hypothetical protein